MNAEIIKGKWHQVKGTVREKWGRLTDDDVDKVAGRAEKLTGILQERYGYAKDRAEKEIEEWFDACECKK